MASLREIVFYVNTEVEMILSANDGKVGWL